ncbi:hypothetical protein H2199_002973 [Coniosporium tulheliwenetii]|uniref:Uncharacterized protein n=1 Tax=Coniosporium tulheliwenetii TaxID=3383036 RepID=A0ACC2ZE95_9PEZI|nr:hypothetical protein H2199_002973 [Cladosporium sp. JES 115]
MPSRRSSGWIPPEWPLRAIRDETAAAGKEIEINMASMKDALAQEEVLGKHHRRIRRKENAPVNTKGAEDWDVLGYAQRKSGKYFVVDSGSE